ncbi:MAG: hypothetical protein WCW02_02205 [Candidatus Buchananbacteria bacterium]
MFNKFTIAGLLVVVFVLLFIYFRTDILQTANQIFLVKSQAKNLCVKLCQKKLEQEIDLSQGPCLANSIKPGWVCDIAHDPRQAVDEKLANQCSAYGSTAEHLVEVTANCEIIRAN